MATKALAGLTALFLLTAGASALAASGGSSFSEKLQVQQDRPAAPTEAFTAVGPDGTERQVTLADFRGRPLIVNFWATWCAPCIEELPSLLRLEEQAADGDFKVLAISNDRGGLKAVTPFLEKHDLQGLDLYLDPKGTLARTFDLRGLPTTFVIDPAGRVYATLEGKAEWDAPEVRALLEKLAAEGRSG